MTRANPAGSWRIMSGVATSWRADVVLAAELPGGLPAQGAGGLQGGGVGDAGQPDLRREVSMMTWRRRRPTGGELGFAVGDGDDLDALAAGVGQPGRQRDRADLGHLVQGHQQRRVEPAAADACPTGRRCSGSRWPWRRTAGRPGLPRRWLRRSGRRCRGRRGRRGCRTRRRAGAGPRRPGRGRPGRPGPGS